MPVHHSAWNGYIGLQRPPIFQTDSQTRLWNNKVHPPQDVAQGGGFITGFEVFQGGTQYFKEGPRSGKAKGGLGGGGGEPTCVFILCVAYEAVEERTNI